MSLAASLVGYIDPADDQRIPRLQPVEVEPVPDPKRKGLWGRGGDRGLVDVEGGGRGGRYGSSGRCSPGQSRRGPFTVGISGGDDAGSRDGVRERRDGDRVLRKGGGGIQRCCCCHSHWSELGISTHPPPDQTTPDHTERGSSSWFQFTVDLFALSMWTLFSLVFHILYIFTYKSHFYLFIYIFQQSEALHYMRLMQRFQALATHIPTYGFHCHIIAIHYLFFLFVYYLKAVDVICIF